MKIKKGDTVQILSGKHKGKKSKVLRALPKEGKVIVEGVNVVKKHARPKGRNARKGQIIEKTLPINVSNVSLLDPKSGKPARAGYVIKDKKKVRVSKESGQEM